MASTAAAPLALMAGEGERYDWFGFTATIKVTAAMTNGELALVEVAVPPNSGSPLHVHYTEDETFYVLEGRAAFQVGDERIEAGAGACLFGPRNIPHRFETGDEPARLLFVLTPSGDFDDFVRESADPANQDRIPEIVRQYGMELLEAPPA